jgi:23S rRNA pseudouridine2605 synthase
MEERLQKVMAHAGVASRRACEEMIVDGRVKVNGKVVTELGTRVDPDKDVVLLDGRPLTGSEATRYILLYKPPGYLSDTESTDGRPCVTDLVKVAQRLYPVGRLDYDSEGLMLLTNDGNLAHKLTHPRYEHPKEYLVLVEGRPLPSALRKLRQGIELSEGKTAPAEVEMIDGPPPYLARPNDARSQPTTWLRMVLREGRKREIRHMTAIVGHPTLRLIRVGLGPLRLVHLNPGEWRDATLVELRHLRRVLQDKPIGRGAPTPAAPTRGQHGGRAVVIRTPRPARRADADRPPRRADADRPPRRAEENQPAGRTSTGRPARRADADRPPRRDDNSRTAGRADAGRPPRREEGDRPAGRTFAARTPRRDDNSRTAGRADAGRPPRREEGDRPAGHTFAARTPRRDDNSRTAGRADAGRPPRREEGDRPAGHTFAGRPPRRTDAGPTAGRKPWRRSARPGASPRPHASGARAVTAHRQKPRA